MNRRVASSPPWLARMAVRARLYLLLAVSTGCASHGTMQTPPLGSGGPPDTLAIIPLRDPGNRGTAAAVRHAIWKALDGRLGSYTVAIQPESVTDERLRAAGWDPGSTYCVLMDGRIETTSSESLSGSAGARYVMVGMIYPYGEAGVGSLAGSLLTAGLVPPKANQVKMDLDLAIYDGRTHERVWTYRHQRVRADAASLVQDVGEPLARRLPFMRR